MIWLAVVIAVGVIAWLALGIIVGLVAAAITLVISEVERQARAQRRRATSDAG
jgi:hypothetical protein